MTTRESMIFLLGQIEALRYPLVWKSTEESVGYYDLIDGIAEQYLKVMKELYPDFEWV